MNKKVATIALGMAIAAGVIAQAPPPGRGPGGPGGPGQHGGPGMRPGPGQHLIFAPPIVAELRLSEAQVQQLHQILPDRGPGGHPGPGGTGIPRNWDEEIKKVLNQHQYRRWRQVELQITAPRVFTRPDVAERLGITEEQREQMHQIMMNNRPPQPPPHGDGPPSQQEIEAMHRRMMEHREKIMQQVFGVLTAQQKRTWTEMIGEPFKFDPRPPRRG